MSEPKTKPNRASVTAFIKSVEDPGKRADCRELMKLLKELTGNRHKMWGDSIVGYGSYDYQCATGKEAKWFVVGFAPRWRVPCQRLENQHQYKHEAQASESLPTHSLALRACILL